MLRAGVYAGLDDQVERPRRAKDAPKMGMG